MKTSRRDPLVSVVMPAFNVERFITRSVESVLGQTFPDFEIVVVDDGSTDKTVEMLLPFSDHRLRIIKQAHSGSSAARNVGVELTTGPYIAFLDGDDLWAPEKLDRHVKFLEDHPEVDLTFSHSHVIDENGLSTGRVSRLVHGYISFRRLLIENVVHNGSAVVMRRDAIERAGRFDVTLPSAVDHDLWLRVALARHNNICCIPQVLTFYRMREGQVTKDWRRMEASWTMLIDKMRRLAPAEVAAVEMKARSGFYRYLAYIAYETTQYGESRALFCKAWRGDCAHLLFDRRMWLLAAALTTRTVLPTPLHRQLDRLARDFRSRREAPIDRVEAAHGN